MKQIIYTHRVELECLFHKQKCLKYIHWVELECLFLKQMK